MRKKLKKANIVYFSGTGCTRKVAEQFAALLKARGIEANISKVSDIEQPDDADCLFLLFAVHAMNAPQAVYDWIEGLQKVNRKDAVVISVSGGGEISPNTACRQGSIKKLEKKGYRVRYEQMIVMPSNFAIEMQEDLSIMLLDRLPAKVEQIVNEILTNVIRRTKPVMVDQFLSNIAEFEKIGARIFGKQLKCKDTCVGCGWCAANCPVGNIKMEDKRPVFSNHCHMCMGCIYGCPKQAIEPRFIKFVVLKGGFRLEELQKKQPVSATADIKALTKGAAWTGVRKYLEDEE